MDLAVVLTTFVVIFPAELPDKSLFASLVLGTRFRPLPVFCGVAAAFAVHVVIAVTVGGLFVALLPQRLVLFVAAALFAGGAALLLLGKEEAADPAETVRAMSDQRPLHVVMASFGVVFIGEWGEDGYGAGLECVRRSKELCGAKHIRRLTDIEERAPFDPYHYRIIYQTFHGMRDVLAPLTDAAVRNALDLTGRDIAPGLRRSTRELELGPGTRFGIARVGRLAERRAHGCGSPALW